MKITLCLLFLINRSLCLAQTHTGIYTTKREKHVFTSGSVVSGSVVEFATNKPLKVAVIKIDTTLVYTDTLGHFRYELPAGEHTLRAGFIGYSLINAGIISVQKGDLITVLFRVKEDVTPLVD